MTELPHLVIRITPDETGYTVEAELAGEDQLAEVCQMTQLAEREARRLHNQAHRLHEMRN